MQVAVRDNRDVEIYAEKQGGLQLLMLIGGAA